MNQKNPAASNYANFSSLKMNETSLSRSSSTSLSSLTSNNSLRSSSLIIDGIQSSSHNVSNNANSSLEPSHKNFLSNQSSVSYPDVQDVTENKVNNASNTPDDHKQYEAACIIQKYYRRYKQYENLHKYTEAAVKIQTRYRIYKSSLLPNTSLNKGYKLNHYQHPNSIDESSENSSDINQFTNLNNKTKMISRKLVNLRQNTRYAPSSSPLPTQTTSISSPATSQANIKNNTVINTEVVANGSQQQVHHHHHHHFHHHFHKNDKIEKIQPPPQTYEDNIFNRQLIPPDRESVINNNLNSNIHTTSHQPLNNQPDSPIAMLNVANTDLDLNFDATSCDSHSMIQNFSFPNIPMDMTESETESNNILQSNRNNMIDMEGLNLGYENGSQPIDTPSVYERQAST